MAPSRKVDQGVVLFNVLVIVAFMSLIVMAMVSMGDIAIARSQRFSEAGQAMMLVVAGENTARAALETDLVQAPDADHLMEPWAKIAQDRIDIEGGDFALEIVDLQGLYNLTNLRPSADFGAPLPDARLLTSLIANLELAPDLSKRIVDRMAEDPVIGSMSDLIAEKVVTTSEAEALASVVTVLPFATEINLNTAPLAVLTAILGNAAQARQLESMRSRKGFLTQADLTAAKVVPDRRAGFASSFFSVDMSVTVGQTRQAFTSLIYRDAKAEDGRPVRLVSRVRQTIAFPAAPASNKTLPQGEVVNE